MLVKNDENVKICNGLMFICWCQIFPGLIAFLLVIGAICALIIPMMLYQEETGFQILFSLIYPLIMVVYIVSIICIGNNNMNDESFLKSLTCKNVLFGCIYTNKTCGWWIFFIRFINPLFLLVILWIPKIINIYHPNAEAFHRNNWIAFAVFIIDPILVLCGTTLFFYLFKFVSPTDSNNQNNNINDPSITDLYINDPDVLTRPITNYNNNVNKEKNNLASSEDEYEYEYEYNTFDKSSNYDSAKDGENIV